MSKINSICWFQEAHSSFFRHEVLFSLHTTAAENNEGAGFSLSFCLNTTEVGLSALLVAQHSEQTTTDSRKLLSQRIGISFFLFFDVKVETKMEDEGCRLKDKP